MATMDIGSKLKALNALDIITITTDTNTDGIEIDLGKANDDPQAAFISALVEGVVTDGTYTLQILDSATSGGSFVKVADKFTVPIDQAGVPANNVLNTTTLVAKIGYIGSKQFIKLRIVSTVTTTGAIGFRAQAILGHLRHITAVSGAL